MIAEFDDVVLKRDLPEENLKAGDVGSVVEVHGSGQAFHVEIRNGAGETLAVVYLPADAVRPLASTDVPGARSWAAE
jgi:hypothetical protein